jgi:ectoine hydroxylase-related dioxygenase (phytanoyl-CoA dioxygenase family)
MSVLDSITQRALTAGQLNHFEREGYLIVRGLYTADETAAMRDHFMALHAQSPIGDYYRAMPLAESGGDLLRHYPRMVNPHRFDAVARAYTLDPRIGASMADLFGEEPLAAQSMHYFKPPGARGQALHQDDFYLRTRPGRCIASWLALDPATRDNGGLFVVPGSHRIDILCPRPADMTRSFTIEEVDPPAGLEPVPADLDSGDVLFFNGSVIHGSWPNVTEDRFRRSFICHYVSASTTAMAAGYSPLLRFSGKEYPIEAVEGGGPCGSEEMAAFERAKAIFSKECETGILQGAIAP